MGIPAPQPSVTIWGILPWMSAGELEGRVGSYELRTPWFRIFYFSCWFNGWCGNVTIWCHLVIQWTASAHYISHVAMCWCSCSQT